MQPVFECHSISKSYAKGKVEVFKNISLSLNPGELLIIRGPNGSGKTTLLKVLAGLVKPNSGDVKIMGSPYDYKSFQLRKDIAYSPAKEDSFYPSGIVYENLLFYGQLYKVPGKDLKMRIESYARILKCEEYLHRTFQELSSGYKRRISILRSMLSRPRLLLLDEPFANMDKETRDALSKQLKEWVVSENSACLITSHIEDINLDSVRAFSFN